MVRSSQGEQRLVNAGGEVHSSRRGRKAPENPPYSWVARVKKHFHSHKNHVYIYKLRWCTTIDLDLFDGFILAHLFRDEEEALWKLSGAVQSQSESMLKFMTLCLQCIQSLHGEA